MSTAGEKTVTVTYEGKTAEFTITVKEAPVVVPPVDKTGLEALVEEAGQYVQEQYTAESWAQFAAALEQAQAVLDDGTAGQTAVDEALAALESAVEGLKPAETGSQTPEEESKPEGGTSSEEETPGAGADTGDTSEIMVIACILAAALSISVLALLKKKQMQK